MSGGFKLRPVMSRVCLSVAWLLAAVTATAQTAPSSHVASITGRVIRPDGIPQPEAEVVTATRGPNGAVRVLPWRARTAFDGRYEIRNVPPGEYLVLVRALGSDAPMDGRPHATLFPGVASTEPGTPVHVYAGVPVEGVDIWLQPSPRRFQVAGRVVDAQARDIDNVAIEFGPPHGRADSVWTLTEPGGLFALEGVPPGPIVLRAYADGSGGRLIGVASTELAIESPQDVRIVVREPGRVRGQVVAVGGSAVPAGLRLSLVSTLLRPSALYAAEAVSPDAGGRFELSGEAGEHRVVVEGLPSGWQVTKTARAASSAALASLWLTSGTTMEDVVVEIGPARGKSSSRR
jgi:hypothetical protein